MIRAPKDIFDKAPLLEAAKGVKTLAALKTVFAPLLREAHNKGREVIASRFKQEPRTEVALAEATFLIDSILQFLYEVTAQYHKSPVPIALVAVGGYGRSELFPRSDIDILFLQQKKTRAGEVLAEWILYCLWDTGLSVGHAVRTVQETMHHAEEDATICTNLLDARFICGDKRPFDQFEKEFWQRISEHAVIPFVDAKLKERDARHQRCGDSRYVLEPNLKEGKGGLRDLQTLLWLARYIYRITSMDALLSLRLLTPQEFKSFRMARDFLWQVRMHMHLIAKRPEERLTFDMQGAVAEVMGYYNDGKASAVEHFMKQYFLVARTVGNLTRSVCSVLEEDKKSTPRLALAKRLGDQKLGDFQLDGDRLAVIGDEAFTRKPARLITLFETAHAHALDIHLRTLQLVTRHLKLIDARLRRDKEANDSFMAIILSPHNPEPTLRRMSEAGVLGAFIPDFGKVIGQMQFNMYHVYTVDEHTLFALGILHGVGTGKYAEEMPLASHIVHRVQSMRVLYMALFCHDIAKGRGGDHSQLGEVIVRKLARRFGFDSHETENCAWLVREHLLMSATAFKRDLGDPKTITDFVAKVQTPERLRLLLLLTACDIRAVGPNVWNRWKGGLLRDIYYAAETEMGTNEVNNDSKLYGNRYMSAQIQKLAPDWSPASIMQYLEEGDSFYATMFDAQTHVHIAELLKQREKTNQPLAMRTTSDTFRAVTEIIVCAPDQQGLFSRVSGALALAGAMILSAKIFTLKSGIAVEIFYIQDINNQAFDKRDKLARLSVLMHKAVSEELKIEKEIAWRGLTYPSRMEVFKVTARVFIDNKVSATHTVVEVEARDRTGLLYTITHQLALLGLSIATAHIATYGERAIDVFYVKDTFGMKILHESKMRLIQESVVAAISENNKERAAS